MKVINGTYKPVAERGLGVSILMFAEESAVAMRDYFYLELTGLESRSAELIAHIQQLRTNAGLNLLSQSAQILGSPRSPHCQVYFAFSLGVVPNAGFAKTISLSLSEFEKSSYPLPPESISDTAMCGSLEENITGH